MSQKLFGLLGSVSRWCLFVLLAAVMVSGVGLARAEEPVAGEPEGAEPEAAEEDEHKHPLVKKAPKLFEAQAELTLKLFHAVRGGAGNLAFSPVSVGSALAMASMGAEGDTAAGIYKALGWPDPALHPDFAALLEELQHTTERDGFEGDDVSNITIANAFWVQDGWAVKADFADKLSKNYKAALTPLDFKAKPAEACATINDTLKTLTNGKISDAVPCNVIHAGTRFVLGNAVYFRARWYNEFSKENTKDLPFHLNKDKKIKTPTMHHGSSDSYRYMEDEFAQVIELGYRDYRYAAVFAVPLKKGGLGAMEAALDAKRLQTWLTHDDTNDERVIDVEVFLPRFEFSSGIESMKALLAGLGMGDAFDATKANFKAITDEPLWLEDATHKAFIRVDEEGTEAAAITTMFGVGGAGPDRRERITKVFRADQPFLFFIFDRETKTILFMGRVADPS